MIRRKHQWPFWHFAGLSLAVAMLAVPRRFRFAAAIRIAHFMTPIMNRTRLYAQTFQRVETSQEHSLYRVLDILTQGGTLFDLEMHVEGRDQLDAMIASGRGILLVTTHAMLNTLVARYLHDMGLRPMITVADTSMVIRGTRELGDNVAPSHGYMLRVRSRLREGGMVCAMIDRSESGRRTVDFDTRRGAIIVSHALFRVAERTSANVIFLHTGLQDGKVRMTLHNPVSDGELLSADTAMRHFVSFVQERTSAGTREELPPLSPAATISASPASAR